MEEREMVIEREIQLATKGIIDALIPFRSKSICLVALERAGKKVQSNHVLFPLDDEENNPQADCSP